LDNACCRSTIQYSKRTRSLPVSKKKPVDADLVKSIIDRFGAEGANELANIQPSDIFFHEEFVVVFVPKSKTDVYREGNYVYISKLESNYCPVEVLRRYISKQPILTYLVLCPCSGH